LRCAAPILTAAAALVKEHACPQVDRSAAQPNNSGTGGNRDFQLHLVEGILDVMRLWRSELELVVKSGFLYVPLLFDPEIAREIQDRLIRKGPAAADTRKIQNP